MISVLKSIWNGLKWFFGVCRGLVDAGWSVVTGLVAMFVSVWAAITDGISAALGYMADVWSALGGSKTALDSLVSGGVPSIVADACGYVANFVPMNWLLLQVVVMAHVFIGVAIMRVTKSWIPSVA